MRDTTKAQMMKLVRNIIDKNVENKEIGFVVESTSHNSAITAGDCYNVLQVIGEGTNSQQRLGDKIKPKSLVITGTLALDPNFQPDTKPMYCRVIIATQKDIKVSTQPAGNVDTNHLLRPAFAGAPSLPFNGNRANISYPVNAEKFRVIMDKTYTFCPTASASGFPLTNAQFRFKKVVKNLPASLGFDDGNGDAINNYAPFVAVGYAYCDGSPADVINTRISTSIFSKLTFEDA